jgi:hypothetical protein
VCPWNGPKLLQISGEADFVPRGRRTEVDGRERERERVRLRDRELRVPGTEAPSLVELIGMGEAEWDLFTRGSAIRRAGYAGLRRNVAVALGNWGAEEAVPVLTAALSDPEPLVRGHAAWALGEIGSAEALSGLEVLEPLERDPHVRDELEAALARCRPHGT